MTLYEIIKDKNLRISTASQDEVRCGILSGAL